MCISFPSEALKLTFEKCPSETHETMKYQICDFLGLRKCASGEHRRHIVCFHHFHGIEFIDAHSGLTNSCILCSQNMLALIGCFDWNRLPTAQWERHYLQNGRDHKNTECKRIDCMHASGYVYKCPIKCLAQTTVAPPS